MRRAVDAGYVLVTNNTTDFTPLVSRETVHPGLVCLNVAPGLMSLEVQRRLFALALEVLQITLLADWSVRVDRYDLPSGK